jgi:predicted secreted Zn-dependent protease
MSMMPGGMRRIMASVAAAGFLAATTGPTFAAIKTSTTVRYYHVRGTTTEVLSRVVGSNPLHGASGAAIANIVATFDLSLAVVYQGWQCDATDAIVTAKFVITLPKASEQHMSKSTRAKWRGLVAFAKRHEETHRAIYLQYMNDFIRKAKRLKSKNGCETLKRQAVQMFNAALKACDQRQNAFDRSEAAKLDRLPLFRGM